MARRRFFVDSVRNGAAELAGDDARHLARVLRAQPGQIYEIADGQAAWLAEIASITRDRIQFRVIEPVPARELPLRLTLAAALIKFDRFEWLLEKATELGVTAILPAAAERSEKGLLEAAARRVERWRRIVFESSQQARRLGPPQILAPAPLATCLDLPGSRLYLEEEPGAPPLAVPASDQLVLAVGPEGGWTATERQRFSLHQWAPAGIGPLILRAETAALAALSVMIHTRHVRSRG